ncbi:FAD-binding oxidoreductase [Azospirillum brasilense]|uniref:FAD-binding oxidoreductase n=1 Tax=Azospirillum brasilense TaxID=192 RepID=A0A6L3AUJ3_AZOBR|nr:FAD-binding oxidoreductase [Azospirillum brasilense]KAA0677441.1 FAD-binding oxidoreductase [Azospirillum brasilense]
MSGLAPVPPVPFSAPRSDDTGFGARVGAAWPDAPQAAVELASFDGGLRATASLQRPDRYSFFQPSSASPRPAIPRGSGLSYAAASFGAGSTSITLDRFDRVLDFDGAQGIVEVEAGITLLALFRFLAGRGYHLPVQPGHGRISVGGCIGADVHGKNHARDGTFISQVESLRLFHPRHGIVELSPSREPELFRATCGGYGLTGVIVSARLRAKPLPGMVARMTAHTIADAAAAAALLGTLAWESDGVYSWHDCAAPGRGFGRGHVVSVAFTNDAPPAGDVRPVQPAALSASWRSVLPVGLLTPVTTRLMTAAYGALQRRAATPRAIDVERCFFPLHGSEAYFRLFGRAGFHESQVIVPMERFADYIEGVRRASAHARIPIALASGKLFAGESDLLRFSGTGLCFAINLPRRRGSAGMMERLDELTLELGGRPNIIKDSRLPRAVVEATYPGYDRFKAILRHWDPDRTFRSELSERLGL